MDAQLGVFNLSLSSYYQSIYMYPKFVINMTSHDHEMNDSILLSSIL